MISDFKEQLPKQKNPEAVFIYPDFYAVKEALVSKVLKTGAAIASNYSIKIITNPKQNMMLIIPIFVR